MLFTILDYWAQHRIFTVMLGAGWLAFRLPTQPFAGRGQSFKNLRCIREIIGINGVDRWHSFKQTDVQVLEKGWFLALHYPRAHDVDSVIAFFVLAGPSFSFAAKDFALRA